MKHCNKSSQCPYGNAFEKNIYAYDVNLHEYDLCPYLLENWDAIMDKIDKIRKGEISMRNPDRLDSLYDNIKNLHKTLVPDWRFGQFICNFIAWYMSKYHNDIFYIEDDKIYHYIQKFIDEMEVKHA